MKFPDTTLEIEVKEQDEHTRIILQGNVEATCESFLNEYMELIPIHQDLTVDITNVTFNIPSVGYSFLVKLFKRVRKHGKNLKIIAPEGGMTQRVFKIFRVEEVMTIHYVPSKN